jgi:hypothetical protein
LLVAVAVAQTLQMVLLLAVVVLAVYCRGHYLCLGQCP